MADIQDEDFPGFLPLSNYRALAYGPNFQPEYRAPESFALDGTNQKLRDPVLGSPFTFRIRPPDTLVSAVLAATSVSLFDQPLREVYDEALEQFETVQARFIQGLATEQELEDARAALAGGRPPAGGNVNIIEAAVRSTNNFSSIKNQQVIEKQKSFTPSSVTQGAGLSLPNNAVAGNGRTFNQSQDEQSNANQLAVVDQLSTGSAFQQLNRILATPPLTLLINPEQLQITYSQKQIYTDRNRFNYVFQRWGEDQPRLSVSGKSAGFVVGSGDFVNFEDVELGGIETTRVSGYQYASKWDSAAWQNLMTLFAFYRNNGYIYNRDSEAHLYIGNIEITYDQWVYVGNFENFSYQYTEDRQHGAVEFSFEFVVSFMYDRAQPGNVTRMPSPTSNATSASASGIGARRTQSQIPSSQSRTVATQTNNGNSMGAPSTAVLDSQIDVTQPSALSTGGLLRGPEIAPGVYSPVGSTSFLPTGSQDF